jgi:DNA repair photolyase
VCEHTFVRWDNLSVDLEDPQRPLPKLGNAVVRTFDAPEALGIRFHEVQAKSALNRVHPAARMPFSWSVNPYRGCTHSCEFCVEGSTPILMADGRTKPLADVRVGDELYGTVRAGAYRRYALTRVLAHWETWKDAYLIFLEDGTELVASGDHRFLTRRGWKHVTGTEQGRLRRPHLTLNDKLMGSGRFAAAPEDSTDYRRGYLCGMIRGDAYVSPPGSANSFRLALADLEALRRARRYLSDFELETREFLFQAAVGAHRAMTAISAGSLTKLNAIRALIEWPRTPSGGWVKGFLAGIFDAEGSHSVTLRISNTDAEIIDWTTYCLRRLGFRYVTEPIVRDNGLMCIRVPGGIPEHLRFFHTVDPAITRKRSIDHMAIKCNVPLNVVSIEPLNRRIRMYDVTTGTGDFIANGVVSHNCFARRTHTYLGLNAGRDFEREIVVKVNVPEKLRAELGRPSWKRESVALGTNTDPYQWVESRYKLMPGIWQAMLDYDTPGSLVSKSPLALRDLSLLQELAAGPGFQAFMSVPTLDERAWRETEPHTPSPRARIEAVRKLNEAGVPAGVLIAPLMPGINDTPEEVAEIVRLADEAGATTVGSVALHLKGEVKDVFFAWLEERRPELLERYKELYAKGAYAPTAERKRLQALTHVPRKLRVRKPPAPSRGPTAKPDPAPKAPEPKQPSLF